MNEATPKLPRKRPVQEEWEGRALASFACRSAESRGRRHEEEPDAFRTEYQRDRDRVIHCEAFRRLQHKTQVFVVHEGDFYRTRMTHSLEVAQIARSQAVFLGANADLVEAVALAHDLGHPPFGHAGEKVLDELTRKHGLAAGFDHNLQCLRRMELLEKRYRAFPGLNLTWEAREAIARHDTEFDSPETPPEFRETLQPSVEAQIVNQADTIAYVTHDLEDALFCGFFSVQELDRQEIPLACEAIEAAGLRDATTRRGHRFSALTRRLIGRLVEGVVDESLRRIGALPSRPTPDYIRDNPTPVVALPDDLREDVGRLLGFLITRVYRHPTVEIMVAKGARVLSELFEYFVAHPLRLPPKLQEELSGSGEELVRGVTDWLAGLTDRYAIELHKMVFDPDTPTLVALD